ncbi:MAG: hypothetical protein AAGM22_15405 [Acidobacteriota bacterium]
MRFLMNAPNPGIPGATSALVFLAVLMALLPSATRASELSLVAVEPCVFFDTGQASAGALTDGAPRDVLVLGETTDYSTQGGSATGCGVPSDAVSVVVSLTSSTSAAVSGSILLRALPGVTEDGFLMRDDNYSEHVILPLCTDVACAFELQLEMVDLNPRAVIQMEVLAEVSGYFVPSSAKITAVTPGSGLAGGGTEGDVSLRVDYTTTQARVEEVCWGGTLVGMLKSGRGICEPDDDTIASLGCTADQVPKWNGSAWACASDQDALGDLNCTTDEIARWDGSAWVCSADTSPQGQSCDEGATVTGFDASGGILCAFQPPTTSFFPGLTTTLAALRGVDNRPMIIFADRPTDIRLAVCDQPSCVSRTIRVLADGAIPSILESVSAGHPTLANPYPFFTYVEEITEELRAVSCTTLDCSAFDTFVVAQSDAEHQVAMRPDGRPIIAFRAALGSDLRMADCVDQRCTSATVVDIDVATTRDFSVAVGSDGNPIFAYWGSGELRVAHCGTPDCSDYSQISRVGLEVVQDVGSTQQIAIGPSDGLPMVVAADDRNGLRTFHCGELNCSESSPSTANTRVQHDISVTTPTNPSLAIGDDARPIVSYHDFDGTAFKVLKCGSVNCDSTDNSIVTIADAQGVTQVGLVSAIVLGEDGLPLLAYSQFAPSVPFSSVATHLCSNVACK